MSSFDSHQDVDGNFYKKIGFFITFLVNLVLLSFKFMAGHLFRNKNSDLESRELMQVKKFDEKFEKKMPAFSFKYQSQSFGENIERIEDKLKADETGINAISLKEDKPYLNSEAIDVHESFIGFKDEDFFGVETDMRFLSIEDYLNDEKEVEKSNSLSSITNSMVEKDIEFESDSESSTDGYSVKELVYDSDMSGFLSDNSSNSINKLEEVQHESFFLERSDDDSEDYNHDHDHMNDEKEVEKPRDFASTNTNSLQIEFIEDSSDEELSSLKNCSARLDSFGEVHFVKDVPDSELKSVVFDAKIEADESNSDLIDSSKETKTINFDCEELDELWEHQELIEQLRMEIKKVRAVGLPTIFEESESPKRIDDFRAFRIDEKFLREDPMDELQKFYKTYRERMRKFDILNYQKMYAMGFLQLKNPLHSMGTQRHSFSTIISHLSQNLLPFCPKKSENNPTKKLFKDLRSELETVYVGQTCLTWEFLRWQYEKSRELPESDPCRTHHYNQVAGEFQQFQVLVQRFTENEPFQGPRLPNYVKQRCVHRNLLQVPVMKEDSLHDSKEKKEVDNIITSEMLEDIMEEAIRVFWEFVKAEKHETPILIRVLGENNVEVQDPSDYEFMEEIQSSLEKKEKKLKDLLRTGNCLVKKFKKPQEDRSNQDLFFSQVDLKLVSRVLKMSKITNDQLIWCQKKLSKINFSERRVQREPSFLLFPC